MKNTSEVSYDFKQNDSEVDFSSNSDATRIPVDELPSKIDTSIRDIYDYSSCTDSMFRAVCPFESAVNLKDCIDFCVPNFLRSGDQITDIMVFATFQNATDHVVRVLSWILFILAWMCTGIRWFVSLRRVNLEEKKSGLQRVGLLFYIIPIFGIPAHFFHDLYTSSLKPIFNPKYLHTMREPGMELAELEFHAFLEIFAESLVSCIISIVLFVYQTTVLEDKQSIADTMLLGLSIFFSIYNVVKSTIIVQKKSKQHGLDWLTYVYMRIQFSELPMPSFVPYLGRLQKDTAKDVSYAGTQLTATDVTLLERYIAPISGNAIAKSLERVQLSLFTLAKLSETAAYRLGSIFKETKIQLFVVELTSVDGFDDLHEQYCRSSGEEPCYKHDFMARIMFRTTGCVPSAVVRCEDIWPYLSKISEDNECKKIFKHFLRGLFGCEDKNIEVDSPEFLVQAFDSKTWSRWRAIEFLLGEKKKFDATFPLPYDDELASNWERGSPISHAVYNADAKSLEFLVRQCKANVDTKFRDNSKISASLLHIAAEAGNEDMIQSLQDDYGIDINQLDSLNRSPLFYCETRKLYDFMQTRGAMEEIMNQTQDSLPLDNMIPHTLEQMEKIAEIYAKKFIAIRPSQQHISSIIITIAEYCCACVATDSSLEKTFWVKFFRQCTTFIPYEFKSYEELKVVVGQWIDNAELTKAEYGHISKWNVSEVKSMKKLFYGKESFNEDINGWDVSSVMDMGSMFQGASSFNGDLSGWDVSSVTDMRSMFYAASSFNGDISNWDVSSVTYMRFMFQGASSFNSDLSGWEVSSVTNMKYMFSEASSFNGDINGWDVSSVTDMGSMFQAASSFNGDLSGWNVSSVTDMRGMFYEASSFNGNLSGWDVSSITNMRYMFQGASSFNRDLSGWDVSSVTDMRCMFDAASSFNSDLSGWDVSSVTDMGSMFNKASSFNGDLSGWDVSSVTNMEYMFQGASSFNGDLSGWDISSVESEYGIFQDELSFDQSYSPWSRKNKREL